MSAATFTLGLVSFVVWILVSSNGRKLSSLVSDCSSVRISIDGMSMKGEVSGNSRVS